MTRVPFFQIDAFTRQRFRGNPAAVLVLDDFPGDAVMRAVAERGGEIVCRVVGARVELEGACIFVIEGEMQL